MADKVLSYWTTPPNVFLVATSCSAQQVLGCISYRKIEEDSVQMHSLSVDPNFRRCGVGRKMVQALIDIGRENGYKIMYLETTSAQLGAIELYSRMDFSLKEEKKFGNFLYDALSGLNLVAFTYKLQ